MCHAGKVGNSRTSRGSTELPAKSAPPLYERSDAGEQSRGTVKNPPTSGAPTRTAREVARERTGQLRPNGARSAGVAWHRCCSIDLENGGDPADGTPSTDADHVHVSSILRRGGTILGTTNRRNPFAYPTAGGIEDRSGQCLQTFRTLHLDALVVIGGDGTLAIAHDFQLRAFRLSVSRKPSTTTSSTPRTPSGSLLTAGAPHRATDFIPPDMQCAVIAKTAFAGPGETVEIVFTAPSTPGTYPYICTFAGHYQAGMKGTLIVK